MAVGMFGACTFRSDLFLVKGMKRRTGADGAEIKILNQLPITQMTGGELVQFSCSITFNARHTMQFEPGLFLLESYAKGGLAFPLIIGDQLIGGFTAPEFVITKCEADYGITDQHGYGLHSTVNLEFKQYRTTISSSGGGLFGNIGGILGQVSSALNSAVGSITGLPGAISGSIIQAVPGVSSVVSNLQCTINQLVQSCAVSGAIPAINSVMS